ncbi:cell wall-binding repeat-containing protein [Metaclostridioides mangenotii]|uniref:cell wall-binding repeat-containing protein n=1 Tax=Metaclostridioides mangenotii TaxID=1540 RepID=UPI0004828E01|nr:cell wall-binding repeat-containing protein [Clostridioides mangenotii]
MKRSLSILMTFILVLSWLPIRIFASESAITNNNEGTYQVFYWLQNADNDEYTFAGNIQRSGEIGGDISIPTVEEDKLSDISFPLDISAYNQSLPLENQYDYINMDEVKTADTNANKTISADGKTIVNVFYSRNKYDIDFYLDTDNINDVTESVVGYKVGDSVYTNGDTYKIENVKVGQDISQRWPSDIEFIDSNGDILDDVVLASIYNEGGYGYFANKQFVFYSELVQGMDDNNINIKLAMGENNYYYNFITKLQSVDNNEEFEVNEDYSFSAYNGSSTNKIKGFYNRIPNKDNSYDINNNYYRLSYDLYFYSDDYQSIINNANSIKFKKSLKNIDSEVDPGSRDGYNFAGWKIPVLEGDKVSFKKFDLNTEKMPSYNLHLFASWTKKNTGGGGGSTEPPTSTKTVILASGEKYTDVLTATVLGNEKDAPILLSKKDSIDEETLAEIKRLNAEEVIISGGADSVSDKVVVQLKDYNVIRISGKDRYETAEKIGDEVRSITGNKEGAMLVDGTNFPDVITISTLASQKRAPILITEPETLNSITDKTIVKWNLEDITIGGSYNSVSKDIENSLKVSKINRLGGVDRYETSKIIGQEVVNLTGNKSNMVLVDGTDFPDGITINSLASKFKSPIMLTTPNKLSKETSDMIKEWSTQNILIGGGYNSVSKSIEDKLNISKKERVAGQDRYETAVKISQKCTNSSLIGEK